MGKTTFPYSYSLPTQLDDSIEHAAYEREMGKSRLVRILLTHIIVKNPKSIDVILDAEGELEGEKEEVVRVLKKAQKKAQENIKVVEPKVASSPALPAPSPK